MAVAMTAVICALLSTITQPVSADGTGPPLWLAVGDSYSSGEGIPGTDPPGPGNRECARANGRTNASAWAVVAYRQLWDPSTLHENQVFTACTGAVSSALDSDDYDLSAEISEANQWLGARQPDVITFSFGGNDIGFPSVLRDCIDVPGGEAAWGRTQSGCDIDEPEMRSRIDMLVGRRPISGEYYAPRPITDAYDLAARTVRPGGHIIILGYPQIIEELDRWPNINRYYWTSCQRIRNSDVATLRAATGYLNEQLALAVQDANRRHPEVNFHWLDISDTYESESGRHALCSSAPWLNGFATSLSSGDWRTSRSYHPTQQGHTATGGALANLIQSIGADDLAAPPTTTTTAAPRPALTVGDVAVNFMRAFFDGGDPYRWADSPDVVERLRRDLGDSDNGIRHEYELTECVAGDLHSTCNVMLYRPDLVDENSCYCSGFDVTVRFADGVPGRAMGEPGSITMIPEPKVVDMVGVSG